MVLPLALGAITAGATGGTAVASLAKSFIGKQALNVITKRKENRGSAFPQLRTPKVSLVSSVGNVSSRTRSRPTRASQSTIPINQARIGNIAGKGSIRMATASGLTRLS